MYAFISSTLMTENQMKTIMENEKEVWAYSWDILL